MKCFVSQHAYVAMQRLSIPANALQHFEMFEGQDVVVKDWTNRTWRLRFSTRTIDHRRPIFTGQWISFAQEKGLQPADLLIFNKLEDGQFRIQMVRETDRKLFGQQLMWIQVDRA
ncbi:hypothetical protein Pint_23900 [Pistacia integerrima]|uniref:Uncharacterized protein n=1 Tax=Pistacia integerrima TaxID=434235 RepID=A0ACC0YLE9_9ROSI|nr:hypothetical protein Pint_23900 [Pistacia integerrima]